MSRKEKTQETASHMAVQAVAQAEAAAAMLSQLDGEFAASSRQLAADSSRDREASEKELQANLSQIRTRHEQTVSAANKAFEEISQAGLNRLEKVQKDVEGFCQKTAAWSGDDLYRLPKLLFCRLPQIDDQLPDVDQSNLPATVEELLASGNEALAQLRALSKRRPEILKYCGWTIVGSAILLSALIRFGNYGWALLFLIAGALASYYLWKCDTEYVRTFQSVMRFGRLVKALGVQWIEETRRHCQSRTEEALSRRDRNIAQANQKLQKEDANLKAVASKNATESRAKYDQALVNLKNEHAKRMTAQRKNAELLIRRARKTCYDASQGIGALGWTSNLWNEWVPISAHGNGSADETSDMAESNNEEAGRFHGNVRIGTLQIPTPELRKWFPDERDFSCPGTTDLGSQSLTLIGDQAVARQLISNLVTRILALTPAGLARFAFIDPVGIARNVAPFLALKDYDERLIGGRVLSEPQDIERKLEDLSRDITAVWQDKLRDRYDSIDEYNREASVLEPYRVLVVFDYPAKFSDTMAARLQSIAQTGPRCGVFTILCVGKSRPASYGVDVNAMLRGAEVLEAYGDHILCKQEDLKCCRVIPDPSPPEALLRHIVSYIGEHAKAGMKVEVKFERLIAAIGLDNDARCWRASTKDGIDIPLGPRGVGKTQDLVLGQEGRDTENHALILGTTGSGKSNLMHVALYGLCLKYAPDELELYLLDLKEGIEFKTYVDGAIPHAKVIGIETEREFALSVLRAISSEFERRSELFKAKGVQNISRYRSAGTGPLPRLLLVIDEFQELFAANDSIARDSDVLLEKLVRKGRSYGIHVVLGSQTLAGSSDLSRAILAQINVRILLKCDEQDARRLLGDEQGLVRTIARPGEGVYYVMREVGDDSRFQVALMSNEDKARAQRRIRSLASSRGIPTGRPVIFRGSEPALIEDWVHYIRSGRADGTNNGVPVATFGEPLEIRPPIGASFPSQSGRNLLLVSRDEARGMNVMLSALASLAAQTDPDKTWFYVLDGAQQTATWRESLGLLLEAIPHQVEIVPPREAASLISRLSAEFQLRGSQPQSITKSFLFLLGAQRIRQIHHEEVAFMPDQSAPVGNLFATLLRDGPDVGIHCITQLDVVSSVERVFGYSGIKSFGVRLSSQLSDSEANHFFGSTAIPKLNNPAQMLFYDEENPGVVEKLRYFQAPSKAAVQQLFHHSVSKEESIA